MRIIAIESPYSGDIARNVRYLAWCVKSVYDAGHAAYAGHGLGPCAYPERGRYREHGLAADAAFAARCDEVWFFDDLGFSQGMEHALDVIIPTGRGDRVRYRRLKVDDRTAFENGEWPPGSTLRWVPAEVKP